MSKRSVRNGRSRDQDRRKPVVVYVTSTCVQCQVLREVLRANGLRFKTRDIIKDAGAMLELAQLTGGRVSVPVVRVGEKILISPNWNNLSKILR